MKANLKNVLTNNENVKANGGIERFQCFQFSVRSLIRYIGLTNNWNINI